MRTVLLSYILSNAICAAVMTSLWLMNRRRSAGLGLWVADYVFQLMGIVLLALQGTALASVSIMFSSPLLVGGTFLLYLGLERYTGKPSTQRYNYFLLTIFALVHAYFVVVHPSFLARAINFSLALLVICSQCSWLMLHRADSKIRTGTRLVGATFGAFSLLSLVRVMTYWARPAGPDLFTTTPYDVLVIIFYQMLFVGLTFSLFLMVNRRLTTALESDLTERKRVEEAHAYLASIVEFSVDAIIGKSLEGVIQSWNRGAERLYGYPASEMIGRPISLIVPPERRVEVAEFLLQIQRGERIEHHETVRVRKDGAHVEVSVTISPVKNSSGEVVGASTVAREITERKRVESALRESEEHFRSLFENMLNGLAYCQMHFEQNQPQDFTYLEVNRAFETLTGLKNVVGRRVSEVIPGIREADPELFEMYGRVALTGVPEHLETFVDALGMWFSIAAYSPKKEYFVAVFDVITERKRAEEALIEERHLLHTLMDNLPDLIYFKDRESRFTRINMALAKKFGLSRPCPSGRQDRLRLLHRRTRQRVLQR